jgi:hypothetical protein
MRIFLSSLVVLLAPACNLATGDVFTATLVGTTDAGEPCTPSSDRERWPVRVVFVVQNSGVMCLLDPPGSRPQSGFCEQYGPTPAGTIPGRISLINRFFADNANRTNLSVAVVSWSASSRVLPFRPVSSGPPPELATQQNTLGMASNLQGALATTRTLIEQDAQGTASTLRSRTRYVVVLLSNGVPFPRCSANDALTSWASPTSPDGIWQDSTAAGSYCNEVPPTEADVLDNFITGGNLNQNAQLFSLVDDLVGLDTTYQLGDVRLHSRLVLNEAHIEACGPICGDVVGGLPISSVRGAGNWLLTQLALHGQGTFVDPGTPAMLSMQGIDSSEFTTFCTP